MKIFRYILLVIAIILVIYNLTKIDYNDPFNSESIIAFITVFAGLCVVLLLTILRLSKKIENIEKRKS
ncbi:MAG: hypothetical protein DRI75_00880 [Bacteroidetes bacterium]|nr:MAG: hypothetical protein DRI75_00880 [Bacteroidota bacterium]